MQDFVKNALALFNEGDYEAAFELCDGHLDEDAVKLKAECLKMIISRKQIEIKQAVDDGDYALANQLKSQFISKYGENDTISKIIIPVVESVNSVNDTFWNRNRKSIVILAFAIAVIVIGISLHWFLSPSKTDTLVGNRYSCDINLPKDEYSDESFYKAYYFFQDNHIVIDWSEEYSSRIERLLNINEVSFAEKAYKYQLRGDTLIIHVPESYDEDIEMKFEAYDMYYLIKDYNTLINLRDKKEIFRR